MDVFGENWRGLHAQQLLNGTKGWTLDKLQAAAFDSYQPGFADLVPPLIKAYDALPKKDPRRDRLCVVQLSGGDGNAHLVQFDGKDWSAPNLKALLADPAVLKIFHFARFDVGVLAHHLGVVTKPVYCTKIASKLVRTYTDRHGLKDLCSELLGVELSKQQQSSDWGAATLTDQQRHYAASDVLHLHALKAKLDVLLAREGRENDEEAPSRRAHRRTETFVRRDRPSSVSSRTKYTPAGTRASHCAEPGAASRGALTVLPATSTRIGEKKVASGFARRSVHSRRKRSRSGSVSRPSRTMFALCSGKNASAQRKTPEVGPPASTVGV